jgi:hypothetical protein
VPQYEIYVLCTECGVEHPMRVRIYLQDGPATKQSIAEIFQGTSVPPQVSAIQGHKTLCLKTGRTFIQQSDDRIFLVPAAAGIFFPKFPS